MSTPSPGGLAAAVVAQIKAERAALSIPLGELAERVGLDVRTQNRYFKGQREMTLATVDRYASALGIDLETLLGRARERQHQ